MNFYLSKIENKCFSANSQEFEAINPIYKDLAELNGAEMSEVSRVHVIHFLLSVVLIFSMYPWNEF